VQIQNRERGELRDLIDGFNAMTRELQKNETELAQMERETAWKEMAKQVAHEIKNPLTPMKLAVQQMIISFREKKNFEAIFERVTGTLLNQIENLNQIASEFSRFARMPHFNLEKVDLTSVLKDTLNLFADEKIKIRLISDLDEALVEADNSQFRRVLINMIRNSIQSGASTVTIRLQRSEEGFDLFLEDNGSGIKPEFRERIFEPDFTTKEKGMGIGLKLARRFIEGIKGTITLVQSSEEGTIFRIFIPEIK
jgi:two-component system, NtrC family, nitrogen regulation sensor histidine kinase NtrY